MSGILARQLKKENNIPNSNVVYLPIKQIKPNIDNFFTIDESEVESLAQDIEAFGLNKPILVRKLSETHTRYEAEKPYEIIDGERRYTAHLYLGKEFIEAKIDKDNDDERVKERLITGNITSRNITPMDYLKSVEQLTEIYRIKKREENLPGRVRALVAKAMKISDSQVARYEVIFRRAIPEIMELISNEEITIKNASELAYLDQVDQLTFIENYDYTDFNEIQLYKKELKEMEAEIETTLDEDNDSIFDNAIPIAENGGIDDTTQVNDQSVPREHKTNTQSIDKEMSSETVQTDSYVGINNQTPSVSSLLTDIQDINLKVKSIIQNLDTITEDDKQLLELQQLMFTKRLQEFMQVVGSVIPSDE